MDRTAALVGAKAEGQGEAANGAIRRGNDVWVLPAARIKQILRGTFLESPVAPPPPR